MNTELTNRFNFKPIKNALYMLQVLIIALAIPVLCIVDLSHHSKNQPSTELSHQTSRVENLKTI